MTAAISALADQGRRVRAGGGIGKHQRHILGPRVAAIDAVGTTGSPLNPADHFQFLLAVILRQQHHFGKVPGGALRGAGKDHVLHAAAAH